MAVPVHPQISEAISEALSRGVTVLTGNQRAARTLRRQADAERHTAGLTTWRPPAIFAWETWTATLWQCLLLDGHATPLLLSSAQEHTLWRAIVAADPEWQSLVPPDALADLAAEAWSRLCAYGGEARLRASAGSADNRAFLRWAQSFTARCRAEGYLPKAQLEAALARHPVALSPVGYLLVGFDRLTPAQDGLLTAIRSRGIAVGELILPPAGNSKLVEATDPRAELQVAASSIREHLQHDPVSRIALIVPDLAGRRAEIDRALRQTLAPERNVVTATAEPPFEFSLGVPLAQTPLVAAALDLLRWTAAPLPIPRIGKLLLSPYFCGGLDLAARASFDAPVLRRHRPLRPELTLDQLLRLANSSKHPVPNLTATLRALRRAVMDETLGDARPHADWADTFRVFLSAAGWGTGLDSVGFQTLRRWDETLDELATLDFTGVRVSHREALAALERFAERTLFAPETRDAPVQVMGPLEAAGSTFDAIWFVGAGDATWPQRPGTSPLVSWLLQRELGMPGTDVARDLDDARRTVGRIAASAPAITFSYARVLPEAHQRPSTALAGLALTRAEAAALPAPSAPLALESVDDAIAMPLPPGQILRGGAEILKHQAACGFRAYAEHRLFARAPEAAEPGMDARDRGSVVHKVLQTFWSRVRTRDALRDLPTDARRALLTEAIETALAETAAHNTGAWPAAYLDVQCERLLTVLDAWLSTEMERKVPFLVRAEELELPDVQIGPLRLTLRVDRVDETEFGDVILDYKTGEAGPTDWLTDRPDEPQLPLYAVVSTAPLAGVAFANIRAGKDMAFQGYQTRDGILPKRATIPAGTLEGQVGDWRETLTALAENFHRGDLRVRPKAYPHTCRFCKQRLLCRLDITLLQAEKEDEDAGAFDG